MSQGEWLNKAADTQVSNDEDFIEAPEWKGGFEDEVAQDMLLTSDQVRKL